MRQLFYAGGSVLTSAPICKAVLRYARSLAEADTADVISIPVVGKRGGVEYAHLLVGPASQMASVPVPSEEIEPIDDEVLAELERRTLLLQPSRPEWAQEMIDVPDLGFGP
jgi:hypothetical protein